MDFGAKKIDFRAELNEEQYRAVSGGDGACLVLAGPGSGKTRTLVYRLAWLVCHGVPPDRIILLTFTNKAAREMLARTEALLGSFPAGLTGGTFHHAGNLALRHHARRLDYRPGFNIIDRSDSRELLARCVRETVGPAAGDFPKPELVANALSFAVNSHQPLAAVLERHFEWLTRYTDELVRIAAAYQAAKRENNVMDFDDLLRGWLFLLEKDAAAREAYQEKFQYVLADEFQDTNRLQFAILRLLAARHGNIMAVGDDAQSIYSFRAADIRNALEFPRVFPGAGVFRLETNYRSVPEILCLANAVISRNRNQFPKKLRHVNRPGVMPRLFTAPDDLVEADYIVSRLTAPAEELVPGRTAVLFRSRYQSARLETKLNAAGIPYLIRGGLRFYEQAHVKDVLAFLRVFTCGADEISWRRLVLMHKGFGAGYFGRLWKRLGAADDPLRAFLAPETAAVVPPRLRPALAAIQELLGGLAGVDPLADPERAVRYILDNFYREYCLVSWPDARERIDEIEELAAIAAGAGSLETFLAEATMGEDFKGEAEAPGGARGVLTLSTIHQAKGLEWDAVFVIGLSGGGFPHGGADGDSARMEEERRLFYVAVTRARQRLFLTQPLDRAGWSRGGGPSRFISELPAGCYETDESWQPDPAEYYRARARARGGRYGRR